MKTTAVDGAELLRLVCGGIIRPYPNTSNRWVPLMVPAVSSTQDAVSKTYCRQYRYGTETLKCHLRATEVTDIISHQTCISTSLIYLSLQCNIIQCMIQGITARDFIFWCEWSCQILEGRWCIVDTDCIQMLLQSMYNQHFEHST